MTKEDKDLLYKEVSARISYDLICQIRFMFNNETTDGEDVEAIHDDKIVSVDVFRDECRFDYYTEADGISIEDVKPYLRPMSSMTEKEKEDMHNILSPEGTAIYENEGIATPCNHHGEWISYEFMARIVDWLNAHHFDYNGLIEKGLALEIPERMYNN